MGTTIPLTSPRPYSGRLSHVRDKDLHFRFSACLAAARAYVARTGDFGFLGRGLIMFVGTSAPAKDVFYELLLENRRGSGHYHHPFTYADDVVNANPDLEGQIKSPHPYRIWWRVFNDAMYMLMSNGSACVPLLNKTLTGATVVGYSSIPEKEWMETTEAEKVGAVVSDNSKPWFITPRDIDFSLRPYTTESLSYGSGNIYRSTVSSLAHSVGFVKMFPEDLPDSSVVTYDWGMCFLNNLSRWWRGENMPEYNEGRGGYLGLKQCVSHRDSPLPHFFWADEVPYHGYCALVAALEYLESAREGYLAYGAASADDRYETITSAYTFRATKSETFQLDALGANSTVSVALTKEEEDTNENLILTGSPLHISVGQRVEGGSTITCTPDLPGSVRISSGTLTFVDPSHYRYSLNQEYEVDGAENLDDFFQKINQNDSPQQIAIKFHSWVSSVVQSVFFDRGRRCSATASFVVARTTQKPRETWLQANPTFVHCNFPNSNTGIQDMKAFMKIDAFWSGSATGVSHTSEDSPSKSYSTISNFTGQKLEDNLTKFLLEKMYAIIGNDSPVGSADAISALKSTKSAIFDAYNAMSGLYEEVDVLVNTGATLSVSGEGIGSFDMPMFYVTQRKAGASEVERIWPNEAIMTGESSTQEGGILVPIAPKKFYPRATTYGVEENSDSSGGPPEERESPLNTGSVYVELNEHSGCLGLATIPAFQITKPEDLTSDSSLSS